MNHKSNQIPSNTSDLKSGLFEESSKIKNRRESAAHPIESAFGAAWAPNFKARRMSAPRTATKGLSRLERLTIKHFSEKCFH